MVHKLFNFICYAVPTNNQYTCAERRMSTYLHNIYYAMMRDKIVSIGLIADWYHRLPKDYSPALPLSYFLILVPSSLDYSHVG